MRKSSHPRTNAKALQFWQTLALPRTQIIQQHLVGTAHRFEPSLDSASQEPGPEAVRVQRLIRVLASIGVPFFRNAGVLGGTPAPIGSRIPFRTQAGGCTKPDKRQCPSMQRGVKDNWGARRYLIDKVARLKVYNQVLTTNDNPLSPLQNGDPHPFTPSKSISKCLFDGIARRNFSHVTLPALNACSNIGATSDRALQHIFTKSLPRRWNSNGRRADRLRRELTTRTRLRGPRQIDQDSFRGTCEHRTKKISNRDEAKTTAKTYRTTSTFTIAVLE
ncbi:uncharacterized protein LACBIDRAFT_331494 [Laccaria bicolor S238N-H82]|uniref:Predicted protein n=1 Tax=Laccaria bicolor (strain S238N-H82 / ATCC MYA-4686) TaxID=486041 RepID=B0DPM6_LACBS|nr:uncharacterized protein LACBIDRAFT_331494 [Laccaria bicolor S238N-H82]EDR03402.1 predicted protein [Laccaria bicolor S238N-H82]|eukprot:XP_001885858.1 predicted protein [Laccaria bicolor S238N-H82]